MPRKSVTEKPIVVSAGAAAAAPARRKSSPKRSTRSAEIVNTPAVTAATEPSREEIALLAYSYWEARGHQGGSPDEDWLRAEQELRASR
jgi:hypothetical protein